MIVYSHMYLRIDSRTFAYLRVSVRGLSRIKRELSRIKRELSRIKRELVYIGVKCILVENECADFAY